METDSSTASTIDHENQIEKLTLQIDCSLAMSTSVSSAFTTPCNSDLNIDSFIDDKENSDKWKSFYENVDKTPPKATQTASYDRTFETAASLLRLSELEDFKEQPVDSLTPDQQAILVFMIVKEIPETFPSTFIAAQVIIKALRPNAPEYKRMLSFVRQGGDRKLPVLWNMDRSYTTFISKNSSWDIKEATTIFKTNEEMQPFIMHQLEDSYICSYTACSALLYYSSYNKLENKKDAAKAIKMNIARYMRDELSGSEIANCTLTDVKGAHLERVLLGMLTSFGTCEKQPVQDCITFEDENFMFDMLRLCLKEGRPVAFMIETFPSLVDHRIHEYSGKLSDYMNMLDREKDPANRSYHALLCVGIKPREGDTPPMLLVQDSCACRPFYAVGMDLLMDMGLSNLQFCAVKNTWRFRQNLDYIVDPSKRHLLCGSPMSFKNGVVRVVPERKKPVKPNPDISRYFEWVDPTKEEIRVEV